MKPLIGITTGTANDKYNVNINYARWVSKCGGVPVILPPEAHFIPEDYIHLDGLLLSGGADIDPSRYGQEPELDLGLVDPARDDFELQLIEHFETKPILGICRGMQLINTYYGGTLYQDIHTSEGSPAKYAHKLKSLNEEEPLMHSLIIEPYSFFSDLVGTTDMRVMSTHHQAVRDLGEGLRAEAWSKDDLIEVITTKDKSRYILGLQWHPEKRTLDTPESVAIFKNFIKFAQDGKNK